MDRIGKILFILPFISPIDLISTLISFRLGGKEGGIIGKPLYELFREPGLIVWSCIFFLFLFLMSWWFEASKRKFLRGETTRLHGYILLFAVWVVFIVEGWWIGVIITNLLLPSSLFAIFAIWFKVSLIYFVSASFFTRTEMKRLIRG